MTEDKYYYISLNHTGKKDDWFALWRPNGQGYTSYQNYAGIYEYDEHKDHPLIRKFPKSKIDPLLYQIEDQGKLLRVLPNNKYVRLVLNISLKDLEG